MVQPWHNQVSSIAIKVDAKVKEFVVSKDTVDKSIEEGMINEELVDTAKQCVEQMDIDIVEIKRDFEAFSQKVKERRLTLKLDIGGLRMSQK